jgi:hypothetical protein
MVHVSDRRLAAWRSATSDTARLVSLLLAACGGCAAVYGVLIWLVSLDTEPFIHSMGDLSRMLGLLPT